MELRSALTHPAGMKKVTPRPKKTPVVNFFRQWRKAKHLTQERLADRMGVSTPTISQLETGKQGFTDSTLAAMADAFDCQPGELLMRDPLDKSSVWAIQEQLRKATPEKRQEILAVVETMLRTGTQG